MLWLMWNDDLLLVCNSYDLCRYSTEKFIKIITNINNLLNYNVHKEEGVLTLIQKGRKKKIVGRIDLQFKQKFIILFFESYSNFTCSKRIDGKLDQDNWVQFGDSFYCSYCFKLHPMQFKNVKYNKNNLPYLFHEEDIPFIKGEK